jgi:hypothetical protein
MLSQRALLAGAARHRTLPNSAQNDWFQQIPEVKLKIDQ